MIKDFNSKNRTKDPSAVKLAGVSGWPIHHSLSPLLHNYWLRVSQIKGSYVHFAVRPDEAVRAFKSLKYTTIHGMNVTLPLKKSAYLSADELTDSAREVGVCNCLYVRGDKLIGHNTDLDGFAVPLLRVMPRRQLRQNMALLIGAGGAARAVLSALTVLGVPEIIIVNRTDERAKALADDLGKPNIAAKPWAQRHDLAARAGLIVNATSAGMSGKPELDINLSRCSPGGFVYDLVYTPLETEFMKQAGQFGLGVIGGLDMLIEQARPSFELFFHQKPDPSEQAKALLMRHLGS